MTKAEYEMSKIDIGVGLRERRCALKLSIGQFAERIGMNRSAVSYWENGHRRPKYQNLDRIAEALNCSVDELIRDCPPIPQRPAIRREAEDMKLRPEKCLNCVWGKIEDNIVFCPFVDCLKHDQVFKNARYGGEAHD